MICECCWCTCAKPTCPGLACHLVFCSTWCFKPEEIQSFDYNCIVCCEKSGFGLVCPLFASVIAAPEWLVRYSKKKSNTKLEQDTTA
jgi:hypothetical protein